MHNTPMNMIIVVIVKSSVTKIKTYHKNKIIHPSLKSSNSILAISNILYIYSYEYNNIHIITGLS